MLTFGAREKARDARFVVLYHTLYVTTLMPRTRIMNVTYHTSHIISKNNNNNTNPWTMHCCLVSHSSWLWLALEVIPHYFLVLCCIFHQYWKHRNIYITNLDRCYTNDSHIKIGPSSSVSAKSPPYPPPKQHLRKPSSSTTTKPVVSSLGT